MSQSSGIPGSQDQEPRSISSDTWATDHIAKTQTCPVCMGIVVKHSTRENNGVMLATYVCAMSHCWGVHWGLAQVTA